MRTFYAILACSAIFVAYVLIGVSLGWKRGGGVIPNLILFACLAAVWKGIRGNREQATGTPAAFEGWQREPAKDDKKDAE